MGQQQQGCEDQHLQGGKDKAWTGKISGEAAKVARENRCIDGEREWWCGRAVDLV
jgi:hypothetical protein